MAKVAKSAKSEKGRSLTVRQKTKDRINRLKYSGKLGDIKPSQDDLVVTFLLIAEENLELVKNTFKRVLKAKETA